MNNKKFDTCVIGVSNVDIHVKTSDSLRNDTSIFGDIVLVPGGVGRNITFGMAALKIHVSFISIFSKDLFGDFLLSDLNNQYISLDESIFNAVNTSKYVDLSVGNEHYGINDINNISEFSISFFQKKVSFLNSMQYVIVDLNMDEKSMEFIANNIKSRLICEATSAIKCRKVVSILKNIYILKANYIEACIIVGCKYDISRSELLDAILYKGVKKAYITMGRDGALYADTICKLYVKSKMIVESNDTVGAGDAFMAGIMFGEKKGWTCEKTLVFSVNLSFCYLSNSKYKLDEKTLAQALDMNDQDVEIFYWDGENDKWIKKSK